MFPVVAPPPSLAGSTEALEGAVVLIDFGGRTGGFFPSPLAAASAGGALASGVCDDGLGWICGTGCEASVLAAGGVGRLGLVGGTGCGAALAESATALAELDVVVVVAVDASPSVSNGTAALESDGDVDGLASDGSSGSTLGGAGLDPGFLGLLPVDAVDADGLGPAGSGFGPGDASLVLSTTGLDVTGKGFVPEDAGDGLT